MVSTEADKQFIQNSRFPTEVDRGTDDSEGEAESEIKLYLDKLKEIVPRCPKHRRVSRLELIQHVIDYICDLQRALEDRTQLRELNVSFSQHQQQLALGEMHKSNGVPRQPLGALPLPENVPLEMMIRDHHQQQQYRHSRTPKSIGPLSMLSLGTENG